MSLIIINEIIKNQDIALHIYNYYLILKHFKNKELTKKRLNLFLNYFKDKPEYYDVIIDYLHFDNPYVKKMIVNDLILEKIIKKHPYVIKYMDDTYKNNEMVIKEACYFNSYYFKYASNELKINIKFILKLLEVNIFVYFFIDEKIRTNNEIYEKIKKINPLLLGLI
jgi:hypothetical protein